MFVAILVTVVASPTGAAVSGKALILDSTVSGGALSEEAVAAEALGLTVDVVDATTWAAMSASAFGTYRIIILGDAACGSDLTPAEANTAVWSGQVDGNVIINGTDPVFHSFSGGAQMTQSGIAFAADADGKTGLYVSLSCAYHGTAPATPVPVLSGLGSFTVTGVGCFDDAHVVATHPALAGLTDASLSNWSCSVHEAFDAWPTAGPGAFTVLAIARNAGTVYTAPDGSVGIPYMLARGEGLAAGDISLGPVAASNSVGTSHTVTALVSSGGLPQPGKTVTFTILSGPHAGLTGSAVTDASGNASFTYTGTAAGADTIQASFVQGSVTQTSNIVTKEWVGATSTATAVSYTGASSVQYSDAALLSGHLQTSTGTALSGYGLGLSLGTQTTSAGPTDTSGNATAAPLTVIQQPGSVTSVGVGFAGDPTKGLEPTMSSSPFSITKEDCSLAYTGSTTTTTPASSTLSAQFGEPDSSPGNWTGKSVSFSLTDGSLATQVFSASTNSAGVASTPATLAPGVYAVKASFAGDGFYKPCTSGETLLTVAAPGSKVTGGGFVNLVGGHTNFGFNVSDGPGGPKGQIQLRTRGGKNRFHGNTVSSVVVAGKMATWTGTGRWNGVSGYSFTVTVFDGGTPGKRGDTISVVVKSPTNSTVFTTGGKQPLKGGNIVVH